MFDITIEPGIWSCIQVMAIRFKGIEFIAKQYINFSQQTFQDFDFQVGLVVCWMNISIYFATTYLFKCIFFFFFRRSKTIVKSGIGVIRWKVVYLFEDGTEVCEFQKGTSEATIPLLWVIENLSCWKIYKIIHVFCVIISRVRLQIPVSLINNLLFNCKGMLTFSLITRKCKCWTSYL